MSASLASATSASTSSVDGLTDLNAWPLPSTNSPLMKRPYDDLRSTTARDSGAGAYSNAIRFPLVEREVVGTGVAAGRELGALHEQVVEQTGRAEAEPLRRQPVVTGGLVDHDEVLDR